MTDGPPSPSLPHKGGGRTARIGFAFSLALLTAGCFQPMYGDHNVVATAGLSDKLGTIDVAKISAPNGTRLSLVGIEVRNDLIFNLTGGGAAQNLAGTPRKAQLPAHGADPLGDAAASLAGGAELAPEGNRDDPRPRRSGPRHQ